MLAPTTNDPRRTLACNDITLPTNSNQNNSFFRRRTQQQTFNEQLDKASTTSSSTKSSLIDEHLTKPSFTLLRQHSSPTNPHHKIDKSTYDNLTNATMTTDHTKVSTSNLERKLSYPINKKANRHATNDSLTSDAYDNYPEKNGYDNYPIIRKTATSIMTTSQNESDGREFFFILIRD
jgi:hypothetical protein